MSGHPLDGYERTLAKRKVVKWQDTRNGKDGESKIVNLAGVVLQAQHRRSRRSDLPMAFVMLSDPTGAFEVTVLSDLLRTHGEAFQPGKKIVVTAIAKWEASGVRLEAKSVRTLEEVVASDLVGYRVYVDTPESIDGVKQTLAALPARPHHAPEPRGVIRIVLTLDDADREVEMAVPGRYPAEPALRGALKAVSGVREVIEL